MLMGTCHCGALNWSLEGDPGSITACNCTLCRRYGALWAYDYEGERIRISRPSSVYTRPGKADPALEIHFCPTCGCVLCWRGLRLKQNGRRRMAVNIRRSTWRRPLRTRYVVLRGSRLHCGHQHVAELAALDRRRGSLRHLSSRGQVESRQLDLAATTAGTAVAIAPAPLSTRPRNSWLL